MHELFSTARVEGIGACTSVESISSSQIPFDTDAERRNFINKIGIRHKRVSEGKYTSADLCYHAARSILKNLDWDISSIGLIISVTQSPDHTVPGNGFLLHARLGLPEHCLIIDLNAGCTGWVNGLFQCVNLLGISGIGKALLLCGETNILSHPSEPGSFRLMGDMGTATALSCSADPQLYHFSVSNFGNSYKAIYAPESGAEHYRNIKGSMSVNRMKYDHTIKMDGTALQTFISKEVSASIRNFLSAIPLIPDVYVLHQPNMLHFDFLVKKAELDIQKTPSIIAEFGNVSSACIPLTLHQWYVGKDPIESKISCHAFGVGLSVANLAFMSPGIICPPIVML